MSKMNYLNERFEDMMSCEGEWPQAIEKNADGSYRLAQTATAWDVWQAAIEASVSEIME